MSSQHFRYLGADLHPDPDLEGEYHHFYILKKKLLEAGVGVEELFEALANAYNDDQEQGCEGEIGANVKSAAEEHYACAKADDDGDIWGEERTHLQDAFCAAALDILLMNDVIQVKAEEDSDHSNVDENESEE